MQKRPYMSKIQRLMRIEDSLLRGECDTKKLAIRHGVSEVTIYKDLASIKSRWKRIWDTSTEDKLRRRIQQHEFAGKESIGQWELSKADKVERTVSIVDEKCGDCKGTGMDGERWCSACDGEGKVTVEKVTEKVTGGPAEPKFMGLFLKAVGEAAKLEGVCPEKAGINLNLNQTNISPVVNISNRDFDQAHGDAIIGMMQAAERLKESNGIPPIDVDSLEVEDSENEGD